MAVLADILKQSQPGVNPQLEEMVAKMLAGSGMAGPQASAAAGSAALSAPGAMGAASGGGGLPLGAPSPGAVPQSGGQPGPESNETFRVLVSKGVPPEIAKQAIGNPELMKQLLAKLFQGQQGPQQQMAPSPNPDPQSAPPLGGGGGYG